MDGYGGGELNRPDLGVLLAAVEASGEAILITSAELDEPGPRIEYVNPAFMRMTGYTACEVLGLTPRLLQGPKTERAVLDQMRAALVRGDGFQGEALNYRKDGTTYMVEWLITPVREANGDISRWISAQRDVTRRRAAEDQQGLMVRELHHRVKNTLATVQAVLNATVRSSPSIAEFTRAFSGRIASLAKTHALITEDTDQVVGFEELLRDELQAYDEPGRQRVRLQGPPVLLSSELAVPIGMALHELTSNALRHGALGDPRGWLEVAWSVEECPSGQVLHWTWNEHDGPPTALPTREGFGSKLLNRVLTLQVGARVDIAFDPDGLRVSVAVPLTMAERQSKDKEPYANPTVFRSASRT
ncbi:HWE histidine kinase domain-containing protein [Methylobacterium sp. E-045]|uniref:HWE histidine kinase domain-containing protein n=1 Tax=Methylobacterium sp. E-045 TaxID=2836575 RepID=UPI001FB93238|nr:HWE histidine kinase domain-containing protein [Methylobacterium sp. E-045]MCJ2127288.1 PAS domain-containing protein [Methylobacterium sp. E-045]